jgi:hypothetical protein
MQAGANGRPGYSNSYELDGISIMANNGNGYGGLTSGANLNFVPAPDMIEEVALEVNSYSVDSGAAASMKVNFTTKGGTNQFHGTIGDRYSGRGLNAIADYSAPTLPASRRWYTGSIGGPILKDKTFFFFSYLNQTQKDALSGVQHWLTNDFTQTWAAQTYPNGVNVQNLLVPFPTGSATGGQVASLHKTGVTAYASQVVDGGHGDAWQQSDGTCAVPTFSAPFFLGSQTGSHAIPCGLEVVDQGNLNQIPRVNGFQLDARIDQYFRDGKDRIYAAYLLQPQVSDFIWWRPGFNSTTPGGNRYLNFNYSHIFSPNLISQTGVGYMRNYSAFTSSPANTIPFLSLVLDSPSDTTDYFGTPGAPENSKEHDLSFREDVTWTHNRHNVKAGLSFKDENYYNNAAGYYSKPEFPVYFGLSDLLDDHVWSYGINTISGTTGKFQGNVTGAQVKQLDLYAQDDWKIKPNLLVSFGLRWDNFGNPAPYGNDTLAFNNISFPASQALREQILTRKKQKTQVQQNKG